MINYVKLCIKIFAFVIFGLFTIAIFSMFTNSCNGWFGFGVKNAKTIYNRSNHSFIEANNRVIYGIKIHSNDNKCNMELYTSNTYGTTFIKLDNLGHVFDLKNQAICKFVDGKKYLVVLFYKGDSDSLEIEY